MTILMRYLPIIALIIGMGAGYKIRDVGATRALERVRTDFAQYQLKSAQLASKAATEALERQQAQEQTNQEIERVKGERDRKVSVLERDLAARARDVRLCHTQARTAPRVSEADHRSARSDPPARTEDILPSSTGSDLVTLAADADRIVSQLEMCQDFARSLQGK
jgi:hypothetical protein